MSLREACCGEALISFTVMAVAEASLVGASTLSKAAMSRGMNSYVFVVYYNALGALLLLPCFLFHRGRPPLTFSILCKLFLLGLIGSYGVICGNTGIYYSSPTLFTALSNLLPAFIFILATIFRLEKLDIRLRSSQSKVLGTIVSIAGAIIVTLYKGHPLINTHLHSSSHQLPLLSPKSNWFIGGALVTAYCLLISIWYIFQTTIVKEYPAELIIAFFYCLFAALNSAIFTWVTESGSVWRLRHEIEYIAIVYTGAVGCVFTIVVQAWYLRKKGPIYVSIFKPFGIVVAVIMSVMFLGDTLYFGSVIGSVIISVGFYGVIWGKFKEGQATKDIDTSLEHSPRASLLGSNS